MNTRLVDIGDSPPSPLAERIVHATRSNAFHAMLSKLRCPITQEPLSLLPKDLHEEVNRAILAGTAMNQLGEKLMHPITGGVINQSRTFLYQVTENAVSLIADEAIRWNDPSHD